MAAAPTPTPTNSLRWYAIATHSSPPSPSRCWSNALVARKKYHWSGLALHALLGALTALAIAAAVSVLQSP